MVHQDLLTLFYTSLILGSLGFFFFTIWWGKKVMKPFNENRHVQGGISGIFIRMMPGLLLAIACLIPTFYLNSRLKQEEHCTIVIQVNQLPMTEKGIKTLNDNADCQGLDMKELFERAAAAKASP